MSWIAIFYYLDLHMLAFWNILATLLFAGGAVLVHRPGWLRAAVFWIAIVEIPTHAILATIYTGAATGFWIFPAISAVFMSGMVLYTWRKRMVISAAITMLIAALLGAVVYFGHLVELSPGWQAYFALTNAIFGIGQLAHMFGFFQNAVDTAERNLQREYGRAEGLLRNILPDPIAARLKDGEQVIADEYGEVTVIFADIVDFTAASAKLTPAELVQTLNIVFTEFDKLALKHRVEKIKTIGDAYMVVVGAPDEKSNHADTAVDMALEMMTVARTVSELTSFPIEIRVGINSGAVVAGVIGTSKFAYDLWGDAVNVASRMESHSEPGKVLISAETRRRLSPRYTINDEGECEVKGKGRMNVFSVQGRDANPDPQSGMAEPARTM
jgi:adenylate cyclase